MGNNREFRAEPTNMGCVMRQVLAAVIVCVGLSGAAYGQAVWGGKSYNSRVCNNASCTMCNSIQRQLSRQYQTRSDDISRQSDANQTESVKYETVTEYREVTRRVKRCNGRQCWYETITERVPVKVRRPVARKAEPPAEQPDYVAASQQPTPMRVVSAMVDELGGADIVYDLGCGDGRIIVSASRRHGCRAIGIEIDPEKAAEARENARANGCAERVRVITADLLECNLSGAMAVSMYLYPDLMAKLVPRLPTGARIVSYQHEIPGVAARRESVSIGGQEHVYYVGIKK